MWLMNDTRLVRSIYRQSFRSTATTAINYIPHWWLGVEEEVHSERFLSLQKIEAEVSKPALLFLASTGLWRALEQP